MRVEAGHRFERLLVLSRMLGGRALVRCDCGKEKSVWLTHLVRGNVRSCGCLHRTHGASKTPVYKAWTGMLQRCENPKNPGYGEYGGRGISVCERWHDFETFMADMGPRPKGMSIEREDVNGNYEPGNCHWATPAEQARNTRRTIFVEMDAGRFCLKDACAALGFSYPAVRGRIYAGWPVHFALAVGVAEDFSVDGKTLRQAAKDAGLAYGTVKSRVSSGWGVERALATPRGAYPKGDAWHVR